MSFNAFNRNGRRLRHGNDWRWWRHA